MSSDVKHFMKHLYLKMHSSVLYSFREMVSSMWAGANLRKILNVCSCWLFSELQPNVEALKRTVQVSLRAPLSSHKTRYARHTHAGPFFTLEGSSNQAFYLDERSMTPFFTSRAVARSYGILVLVVQQTIGCHFDYFYQPRSGRSY